jgi:hypothetical protein
MATRTFLVLSITLLLMLAACDRREHESAPPKPNVLKEYVNTPLDKARAASERADERSRELERAAKELDSDQR